MLGGEPGPVRDAVLLNAAAALVAHDKQTSDLDNALRTNVERAGSAVDSGAASELLSRWTLVSNELASRR
jgi:anthranilate phosphoribosyltransferase